MRIPHLFASVLALGLVPAAVSAGLSPHASASSGAPPQPTLVSITAAHHTTYDRVVFRFRGGPPPAVRAHYVRRLVNDASGEPVRIAGRAVLRVRMTPAAAHTATGADTVAPRTTFALPDVMTTVRAGDFEGVLSYGIGLARGTAFDVFTLRRPSRVVVDVHAAFRTVGLRVWYFDRSAFAAGTPPYFVPRFRPVLPLTPATSRLDRLFAGVLPGEHAQGLRLLRSGATGFRMLSIRHGIARVQLTGGCTSGGSTATVAGEVMPTLRAVRGVSWVKIYGPGGHTERPHGATDSIPACLEP